MDLGLLRDHYRLEIERRRELTTALSLPVGVLTVLGGLLGLELKGFSYSICWLTVAFSTPVIITVVLYGLSLYNLIRSYHGYTYLIVPTPKQQKEYLDGLVAHYTGSGETDAPAKAEFEEFLVDRYIDAVETNTANNNDKAEYLHESNRFLILALVGVLLSGIPYLLDSQLAPPTVQRVEVTNLPEGVPNAARSAGPSAAAVGAPASAAEAAAPAQSASPGGSSAREEAAMTEAR